VRLLLLCLCSLAYWACSLPKARPNWEQAPVSLEFRLAESAPASGLTPAAVYGERDTVYLHSEVQLSNNEIARAEPVEQPTGMGLRVWLTEEGSKRISRMTAEHIGDRLAVVINSQVVSASVIVAAFKSTPETPTLVVLQLPPEHASQLAKAVSETWPTRPSKEALPRDREP
jgi:preprotein translocase subunit SecD